MRICGFQKLTLLDYPEHTAATLFIGGCNFRCPFCQNGPLVLTPQEEPSLSQEEVLSYLKKRLGILDGVCITGGEPTLYKDLPTFLERIKQLGYLIKLDTNGTNPKMIESLYKGGLIDYVAMDIKSSRHGYSKAVGIPLTNMEPILSAVSYLMNCGIDYEFRTTVVREFLTREDFADIAGWISGCKRYYLQTYQDSDNCIQSGFHSYSKEEMEDFKKLLEKEIPLVGLRGID